MPTIDFNSAVNLNEAANNIICYPTLRHYLVGEPGIGKTSIMELLIAATGMKGAIMSCPEMDLGDIAMPVIHHETKTTRYYPNARFMFHTGEPMIICLDEYTKAPQPVQNMLHPLLEIYQPRLGDIPVPEGAWPNGEGEGSIILLTGNNESDGVGDSMLAHTKQRVIRLPVSKPDHEIWLPWAADHKCDPIVMAWVYRYPHCLASYTDGHQDSNEFIFNPTKMQDGVVSPRTLMIASALINGRGRVTVNALRTALEGVIGKSATESIMAFIRHQDSLPSWKDIVTTPMTAEVPTDPGAISVLVFGGVERVEEDTLSSFMDYLERIDVEWETIFCVTLARHKSKQAIAFKNKRFADWVTKNEDLL